MRDSFIFYRSFYDAIAELPLESQGTIFNAICAYSLYGEIPEFSGVEKTIFILIKPQLDANIKRYENGRSGGRPRKIDNQTETKPKPKNNQTETKPKANKNVNVNVNVNKNDNKNVNILEKPSDVSNDVWSDFLTHRKMKKASVSKTVISNFRREADKSGITLERAMEVSIAMGWQGYKAEWDKSNAQKDRKKTYSDDLLEAQKNVIETINRQEKDLENEAYFDVY